MRRATGQWFALGYRTLLLKFFMYNYNIVCRLSFSDQTLIRFLTLRL